VIHTDLYEVDLAAKITVQVPLRFIGRAVGVTHGGILQPIVREVEVECLPLDIPSAFNVDVSALDIGDSIHVEEIQTPEGVSLVFDSNFAVVTVATPTVEEAPAAAAPVEGEAAVAAVAEPKEETSGED
jgi:large subunit ribosomal protein L25